MKAYRGIRGTASLILNLGQWLTSRPDRFNPGKEAQYSPRWDWVGLKPIADGFKKRNMSCTYWVSNTEP
jgi:hypothetical protein